MVYQFPLKSLSEEKRFTFFSKEDQQNRSGLFCYVKPFSGEQGDGGGTTKKKKKQPSICSNFCPSQEAPVYKSGRYP